MIYRIKEVIGDATLKAVWGLIFSRAICAKSTRHPTSKFITAPLADFQISSAFCTGPAMILVREFLYNRGAIPFFVSTFDTFHHFAATVNPIVTLAAHQLKVFKAVVYFIIIYVVNDFSPSKGSA